MLNYTILLEDNKLYKIDNPSAGTPNQTGELIANNIKEFLGADNKIDGKYLKVLNTNNEEEFFRFSND